MSCSRRITLQWALLAAAIPGAAKAARVDLDYGTIRREGGAAVTATLHDVEEIVEKDRLAKDHPRVKAYRLKVHVVEVLYGEGIAAGDVIPIGASYAGYGSVWEGTEETAGYGYLAGYGKKPPEGTKVIAYFRPAENGRRDLYGYSSSVLVLDSFDDPRVEMWRRIAKLWSMPVSRELAGRVFEGARSENAPYQMYCLGVLDENREGKKPFPCFYGIWLEGVVRRGEVDAALWKEFTSNATPFDAIMECDRILMGRDPKTQGAWRMHPVRYDVIKKTIERYTATGNEVDWQKVERGVAALTACPQRRDQTRQFILNFVEKPETPPIEKHGISHPGSPKNSLRYLSELYVPGATSSQSQALNKQIVDDVLKRLDDSKVSWSAALTLWNVADQYASVGVFKKDIVDAILAAQQRRKLSEAEARGDYQGPLNDQFLKRVEEKWPRARAAIGDMKLPPPVSWPYDKLVGKQVYVLSRGVGDPPLVWIDGDRPQFNEWPEYWIAIGTLRKESTPSFDLVAGREFGEGVPVPPGMRAETIAVRYTLLNPHWVAVPRAASKHKPAN